MNWKLKFLLINLNYIIIGTAMFYLVFTTGNGPNVLNEDPSIYYLILGVAIASALLGLIGINLHQFKEAKK